jgi:hypothetical protein
VLARAQQDAVWHRNRIANEVRSLLREFYPGFLTAFVNRTDGLAAPMARRVLVLAVLRAGRKALRVHSPVSGPGEVGGFPSIPAVASADSRAAWRPAKPCRPRAENPVAGCR